METLAEFAMSVMQDDHMLNMDIIQGYRHFRLHPDMRDWFLFHYNGCYYQCVALPFGWGRSPLWFTELMVPFVTKLRSWDFRILPYIDDFLIIPSPYVQPATLEDCREATHRIDALMISLGLSRNPENGEWNGSRVVEHLGVIVDTVNMRFYVMPSKADHVRSLARDILREVRMGKRWVTVNKVRSFCGVCVSLMLALPWARFYTRSLYWDIGSSQTRDDLGRCRLSHQSIRDLQFWRQLTGEEMDGRPIVPRAIDEAMHTDAADVGYGGTLNTMDHQPGLPGMWCDQGVWLWQDRARSINFRELKAIRMTLQGVLGQMAQEQGVQELLLHVDNQAVKHITNSFVSASRQMMHELRLLKAVLSRLRIHIRADWLPSAFNRYADALSRRFPRGDLRIRRQVRRSVVVGMLAPREAFPYRPLGEHPVVQKKLMLQELEAEWDTQEFRLLCPPVDLIGATVNKLARTKAAAVLLIPDWPRQAWHAAGLRLASSVRRLPLPPEETWEAQRSLNARWKLLELQINVS